MNNIVKLIAKEVAKSDSLVNAKRGEEIKVDFSLSGSAIVKKGDDFEQVVSFALPYDKIVAVLLSKLNGVTLDSVVREALELDIDDKQIKAQAAEALKRIKGTATRRMSGKITTKDEILEVGEIDVCLNCK